MSTPQEMKEWRLRRHRGETPRVDAIGTVRRLEALAFLGWPQHEVVKSALGFSQWPHIWRKPGAKISHDSARKIAGLYDELSAMPGPSKVTATNARKRGYAPPLAWDNIDNPRELPKGLTRRSA